MSLIQNGVALRDGNGRTVSALGVQLTNSKTLIGNNTTVAVPLFTVTGSVEVLGLYGTVTTALGANNTTAFFRLNDQTAQPAITLATGTTLSGVAAGSIIVKKGLAAAAVTLLDNSAGRVSEPTTLETQYFSPFVAVAKTGALTQIEFVYSTTDTPTSGIISFTAFYIPLSPDGALTSV